MKQTGIYMYSAGNFTGLNLWMEWKWFRSCTQRNRWPVTMPRGVGLNPHPRGTATSSVTSTCVSPPSVWSSQGPGMVSLKCGNLQLFECQLLLQGSHKALCPSMIWWIGKAVMYQMIDCDHVTMTLNLIQCVCHTGIFVQYLLRLRNKPFIMYFGFGFISLTYLWESRWE